MAQTEKAATTTVDTTGESFLEKDAYVHSDSSNIATVVEFSSPTDYVSDASNIATTVTFDLECSTSPTDESNVATTVTFGSAADPSSDTRAWVTETKPSTGSWATESAPS
jgi:hypothetical protein